MVCSHIGADLPLRCTDSGDDSRKLKSSNTAAGQRSVKQECGAQHGHARRLAEVATGVATNQLLMIESKLMQNRGLDAVHGDFVFRNVVASSQLFSDPLISLRR